MFTILKSFALLLISIFLGGLCCAQKMEFSEVNNGISNTWIPCIAQDKQGFIWVGTQDGLNRYDGYKFDVLKNDPDDISSLPSNFVIDALIDMKGNIWVGTHNGGLSVLLKGKKTFRNYNNDSTSIFPKNATTKLIQAGPDLIIAKTGEKSYLINQDDYSYQKIEKGLGNYSVLPSKNGFWISEKNVFYHFRFQDSIYNTTLTLPQTIKGAAMLDSKRKFIFSESNFWIVSGKKIVHEGVLPEPILEITSNGHLIYMASKNSLYALHNEYYTVKKINTTIQFSEKSIQTIYLDKQSNLWIGTNRGLFKEKKNIEAFLPKVSDKYAIRIVSDGNTVYFGGTEGLFKVENNKEVKLLEKSNMLGLYQQGDTLWTASRDTVYKFVNNLPTKNIPIDTTKLRIFGIAKDVKNRLWLGSWKGLYIVMGDKVSKRIPLPTSSKIDDARIMQILFDTKDRLWVSTYGHGVFMVEETSKIKFNDASITFKNYKKNDKNSSIPDDIVIVIEEEKNGSLWFGTRSGVVRYNEKTENFSRLQHQGRPFNENIMDLKHDGERLWITTANKGIFTYNTEEKSYVNYIRNDGLLSNSFLFGSGFFDAKKNRLYFGTDKGIQAIDLNKPFELKQLQKPLISEISINNTEKGNPISPFTVNQKERITLESFQNDFSIRFSALDFNRPEKVGYTYRLDNKNWATTDLQTAYFTNVSYGEHLLKVKTMYDGKVSEDASTQLVIFINPPWYRTNAAYVLYVLLFLALLFLIYHLLLRKKLAVAETQKTLEIDEAKSKMYANISHEFKTPLTLIKGLTNNLLSQPALREEEKQKLQSVNQSGNQLLNLVDQMLDLVSLDHDKLEPNYKKGDVIAFIKKCVLLYSSYADSRRQTLRFSSSVNSLEMDVDDDKLQKILNNLLSNAVKFTPEGGTINVSVLKEKNQLFVTILDTGRGISAEELPKIFDRYYKTFDTSDNLGSGIGMALTQELVHLLQGNITVKSEMGEGTQFEIALPINQTERAKAIFNYSLPFVEKRLAIRKPTKNKKAKASTVLVVEDNPQVRDYLNDLLARYYKIKTAKNGKEALRITEEKNIHCIISDVMMPEMNGLEFCKRVKNNVYTSHIPFVMVSAKTNTADKVKGYQLGIDAYITKPFIEEELLLIIKNLLFKKEQQQGYFKKLLGLKKEHKDVEDTNKLDVDFIKEIQEFALDTSNNGAIEDLTKQLVISRTQLYRKVKALTGMSITQYINHIRIEKARYLLKETDLAINEIAYEIGFEDARYFAKIFKKAQGKTPSQFRKNLLS